MVCAKYVSPCTGALASLILRNVGCISDNTYQLTRQLVSDWDAYGIFFLDWVQNTEVGALLLRCLEGGQSDVTNGVFIGDDILGLMGRR